MLAAKPGEIADHAAAQRDDEIAALEAHLEQPLAQPRQHREALRRLAGRHHLRLGVTAGGFQARLERREVAGGATLASVTMPHLALAEPTPR